MWNLTYSVATQFLELFMDTEKWGNISSCPPAGYSVFQKLGSG